MPTIFRQDCAGYGGLVAIMLACEACVSPAALSQIRPRRRNTQCADVGTGPEAHALRHHLESIRHWATRSRVIDLPERPALHDRSRRVVVRWKRFFSTREHVLMRSFYLAVRAEMVQIVLEQARIHGVDLRVVRHVRRTA